MALLGLVLAFLKGASIANERYDSGNWTWIADEVLEEAHEIKAREEGVRDGLSYIHSALGKIH